MGRLGDGTEFWYRDLLESSHLGGWEVYQSGVKMGFQEEKYVELYGPSQVIMWRCIVKHMEIDCDITSMYWILVKRQAVSGISGVSVTSESVSCLTQFLFLYLLWFYCISLQKWHQVEKGGLVKHIRLSLCIDSKDYKTRGLTVERCDSSSPSQHWSFAVKKLWWSVSSHTCT